MTRAPIGLLGVLATLAVSATAAATASAHSFGVEGTAVSSAVEGGIASSTSHLRGVLLGTKVDVISSSDSGTFRLESGGKDKATITFTGNSLYEVETGGKEKLLSSCTVQSPITFGANTELVELSSKLVDHFEGTSPPLLVKFSITGSSCALKKAVNELAGSADSLLPEGEVSKSVHTAEFEPKTTGSQSLKFNEEPATFESSESLELCGANTGKTWSANK